MKKCARKNCRKMFLEAIFSHSRKRTKFLLYMISLAYKISYCLSANCYPELRCVICTGVTLFALVLHLNCTALRQSESSNVFMCVIIILVMLSLLLLCISKARKRVLFKSRARRDF